ncbi:MAG TPA: STAS domain-containing protein, partial [Rhodanobacteraceae bacterium]|nr:STAS domain-containing protein [Rhodanobacteraceae bacterium]
LALNGALTFASAAAAWREGSALLATRPPRRLDLAAISQADSAGLACVLALLAAGRQRDPALRIVNAPAELVALARVCDAEAWIADAPPA